MTVWLLIVASLPAKKKKSLDNFLFCKWAFDKSFIYYLVNEIRQSCIVIFLKCMFQFFEVPHYLVSILLFVFNRFYIIFISVNKDLIVWHILIFLHLKKISVQCSLNDTTIIVNKFNSSSFISIIIIIF